MVDRDVIIEKIGSIKRCLYRIKEKTQHVPSSLDNIDVQDIFVLNLQRAIQSALDIAAHIIASEGCGLPSTLREHFKILYEIGVFPLEFEQKMERMVGFRNIAIHAYKELDINVLKNILSHHLQDIEKYIQFILKWVDTRDTTSFE